MRAWSADRLLRTHASAAGDAPAILDASSSWSWGELDARCTRLATALHAAGVRPGSVLAIVAEPSAHAVAAILGGLRAGALVAPLPSRLAPAELDVALGVVAPALVLHDGGSGPAVARSTAHRLAIEAALEASGSTPSADAAVDPEAPAVVVLTSGTTGRPRGVVLSARAMAASAESWLGALPPATGWLLALGLGHVAGLGVLWRSIAGRVPLRIVPGSDPAATLAALDAAPPVSHVSLVPAQLHRLLADAEGPPSPTLRAVLLGGGSIPPDLVLRALDAGWPVVPTYGLSEAASGVTALATGEARVAPGTAGRPLPGVQVRIEAPDADGVGEIVVTSPASFGGYLGEAPRAPGEAIRTGDLGWLDPAGRLVVVDRRTDRIVRGGENLAPAEVEALLLAHPSIADAAVVARPDAVWGQVPVAMLVARPGAERPDPDALAAHCRRSLAGFKVPAEFRWADALPRTSGGKLRRAEVRAALDRPRPGTLTRPDGARIGWRTTGSGHQAVILLHGTLSNATQLDRLAAEIARAGDATVHAMDRRASGTSRVPDPAPTDVAVHVADLVAILDRLAIAEAILVGLSYGGVLALETAARHPRRVLAIVAWEPPYGPLADEAARARLAALAAATEAAHRRGGAPAAAETFLRAVAGDAAWDRLPSRSRAFLAGEGDGALADAGLLGVDGDRLGRITCPTTVLTGGASQPFYRPIADALAGRIPGARRVHLDGLDHPAPITDPAPIAAVVLESIPPALEPRRA